MSNFFSNIWEKYKDYIIALLLSFIICTQPLFPELLNNTVGKLMMEISYGWHTILLLILFCGWSGWKLSKLWNRHIFNETILAILLFCIVTYPYYRFCNVDYTFGYEYLIGNVTYMDILWIIALLFFFEGVLNSCHSIKLEDTQESNKLMLDKAIRNPNDDELYYYGRAYDIAKKINDLPYNESMSIAVLSPWGFGKTSFMNLLKYAVEKGGEGGTPLVDCIIIDFNPRQSKTLDCIQGDFFNKLIGALKPYNSNVSPLIHQYLSALRLYIDNPFLTFLLKLASPNAEKIKEKINNALLYLPKRVIVFIDDFDRLTGEEMIEVFKMIDKNASFSNIIFFTAFDQDYVNNALNEYKGNCDIPFADKFFTLEYQLPIRPLASLIGMLFKMLSKQVDKDRDLLRNYIFNHKYLFEDVIRNVRDVKRFYNQFITDYKAVEGEVIIYEYLIVELIKYRFYDEFMDLKNKEFIEISDNFRDNKFYQLKNEYQPNGSLAKNAKSIHLIRELFDKDTETLEKPQYYLSIQKANHFDIYFYNKLYGRIPKHDLDALFTMEDKQILSKFQTWIDMNLSPYIIEYLEYMDWQHFKDTHELTAQHRFQKFIKITALLSYMTKENDYKSISLLANFVNKKFIQECEYYGMSEDAYKKFIVDVIYGDSSLVPINFVAEMILGLKNAIRKKTDSETKKYIENQILSIADYDKHNLEYLKKILSMNKTYNSNIINVYSLCVEKFDMNDKLIISKDANDAMKEFIESDSSCEYLKTFIRIPNTDKNIELPIEHEPFVCQIFGITDDNDPFEKYVKEANLNDESLRKNILKFWDEYKAHNMKTDPSYQFKKGKKTSLTEVVNNLRF